MHFSQTIKMKQEAATRRKKNIELKAAMAENKKQLKELERQLAAHEAEVQELRDRKYAARKEAEAITGEHETDMMSLLFLFQETMNTEAALKARGEG